ncbi:glutamate 5-kinase [Alkalihalobacillus hwajinpoensis]|uniref:glutamate 5-kinase n=1 Tax=Guptibacillus hwajinpoensis TaxID=208199 RepID=UPI001883F740|nr:glutamate 5-kinase [Pseudalkalibacillus hwajinpoensis]MBF0705783.1 glutamate 5-kinase [Pseudalkalibacillus hwajinpoensis]
MRKKRIVVKIGSSSLTNGKGEIDLVKLIDHVNALTLLRQEGHEVLLVSSGAVAAGFKELGYPARPVTLKGKQAAAALGQSLLIKSYIEEFNQRNISVAQILLTRPDFSNQERYKNAFDTLSELLARGVMPIINENDTVSTEELKFGDNDMLSALVSGLIHANELIILTDVNGIYDSNPATNPDAIKFHSITEISDKMIGQAGGAGSSAGTGGMKSKLIAAKTAVNLSVRVFIGHETGSEKLLRILSGVGDGTYISREKATSFPIKKQWIAMHSHVSGQLYIDEGAEKAIVLNGKSLLYGGIKQVVGSFEVGDVVEVLGKNGKLGKGQVRYSSAFLENVIQDHENESSTVEVIHRDQWVSEMMRS